MRLGLRLPQRAGADLQHDITTAARAAEDAGYDSVWAWERLLFPVSPRSALTPGEPWPSAYRQAADPLLVLAAAAVATARVRLGTSVMVAGLHKPLQLAKSFATLDQISGGRTVAGLAAGWAEDEFDAVGEVASERGALLDETLDVFEAAWGADPVRFRGRRTVIDDAFVLPKPASHIPVLLGGDVGSRDKPRRRVLDRIARRADGWMPLLPASGQEGTRRLQRSWELISESADAAGRDVAAMQMIVVGNITFADRPLGAGRGPFSGSLDEILDDIAAVEDAGADELILDLHLQDWWHSTAQMIDTAREIRSRVGPSG